MSRALRAGITLLLLAATSACAPAAVKRVEDYFPLGVGHGWLYEVKAKGAEPRLLEFRIVGERSGDRGETRFLLDESGDRYYLRSGDVVGLSISPGIWTVLLSGPLRIGQKFDGALADYADFGFQGSPAPAAKPDATPVAFRTVKSAGYKVVTSTERRVEVPAGVFEDCLEVTHIAGSTIGVKYFAPGIGLVFAEAWFNDPRTNKRGLITRQELVHYRVGDKTGGTRPAAAAQPTSSIPQPEETSAPPTP